MILTKMSRYFLFWISAFVISSIMLTPSRGLCAGRTLSFLHSAPSLEKLPYPSQDLELVAKIKGTKDTEATLKIVVVRDGRSMEVLAQPGYLDEHDIPTYKTVIPSPVVEFSYHFILTSKDGSIVTSPNYFVKRDCIPNIELSQPKVPEEVIGNARLQELVASSKSLENDLSGYDSVIKLLEEIQRIVKQ